MVYSKIVSTAIKVSHLTQLNTYVTDKNGDFVYHDEKVSIPAYMPGAKQKDVLELSRKMKETNQVYTYINPWGLSYLGSSFLEEEDFYAIIIGPYFEVIPDVYGLVLQYNLTMQESADLRNILEKVNVVTTEQLSSYEAVLQQFEAMKEAETNPLVIYSKEKKGSIDKDAKLDNEADLVTRRYSIEKDFMHAVEKGNKEEALKLISSDNTLFSFSERFPNQPLRRVKNLNIVLNTLLRSAARNSHVPAILIHRISERFSFDIENGENIAVLRSIQDDMIREYCELVKSNSLRNYSQMIQKVIEYVMSYYDQEIDKAELAALSHTHPGNLSRRFKKETGMTITEYQQDLRISQARHLLRTENLPVDEIAWIVGYKDPSYFGRVFKNVTGYSPSVYREGGF
ncbi:AraC family transcriptional regulator [Oceanobacillus profundus]|uniref:helix-turn-helix domain-containing protein n=1 Tax=Oceanobacillus profundus TaxID=372463 RepID=UPI00203DC616|nr:AraC family transcriptional regulator [Oceanobacillus profundus]MCM3398217.1 AraC family transcriptional regulator [Oceanobacillus profundus]